DAERDERRPRQARATASAVPPRGGTVGLGGPAVRGARSAVADRARAPVRPDGSVARGAAVTVGGCEVVEADEGSTLGVGHGSCPGAGSDLAHGVPRSWCVSVL